MTNSLFINPRMLFTVAPSVFRMPISFVRLRTFKEASAKIPDEQEDLLHIGIHLFAVVKEKILLEATFEGLSRKDFLPRSFQVLLCFDQILPFGFHEQRVILVLSQRKENKRLRIFRPVEIVNMIFHDP